MQGGMNLTYEKLTRFQVRFFIMTGILSYSAEHVYTEDTNSTRKLLLKHFPRKVCLFCILIYNTMFLGYGFRMLYRLEIDVDYICEIIVVQGVSLRYYMLYKRHDSLYELVNSCFKLWFYVKNNESETVEMILKIVSFLRVFFTFNGLAVVTFYFLTAQVVRLPPIEVNGTERRILPFKFYVDVQEEPWYLAATLLQLVVCYVTVFLMVSVETVGPFLITMACGYLRIIQNRFIAMAMGSTNQKELVSDNVAECIKFHQDILKYCSMIDAFSRDLFMAQVSTTVYNTALILLTVMESGPNHIKQISIMILSVVQFFTCQWIPEILYKDSEAVGYTAYATSLLHPKYNRKANRLLLILILRASKPVQLTAGGYIKLSLENFKQMTTSAFSFFTVMRSMRDQ